MRLSKTTPETSARMKRIRQRHTKPELEVRAILRKLGVSYRTCVKSLPGSPDVANKARQWAIFVNGCFWHGHSGCSLATLPKTNQPFWVTKLDANRRRDARKVRALRSLGFRVVTVWQCELRNEAKLARRLRRELEVTA